MSTRRPTIFFDERTTPPVPKVTTTASKPGPKSQNRGKKARGSTKSDKTAGDKEGVATQNEKKQSRVTLPTTTNKSRSLLLEQWKKRQAKMTTDTTVEEIFQAEEQGSGSIKDIVKEAEDIDTVKKASVFSSELTEQEQDIIKKRVALQQRQYEEFRKREITKKYAKIRLVHRHVSEQEVEFALKECNDDEAEVIERLTKPGFLQILRKKIAFSLEGREFTEKDEEEADEDAEGSGGNSADVKPRKQRKRQASDEDESGEKDKVVKRRRGRRKKESNGDEAYGGEEDSVEKKRASKAAKGRRRMAKLKLDDALAGQEQSGQFAGWSEARIRAYRLIEQNPNAYYYRFNAPGEAQRNGPWSKEEKEMFFNRMKEIGVNRQWGIFSMVIPGRVGYQCSNFYRHLIEKNKIKDENYEIDANGKAHFKFKGGPRQSWAKKDKDGDGEKKPSKKRKRNSLDDDDGGGDEDTEYRPPPSRKKQDAEEQEEQQSDSKKDNPLPGFIDPITLDEVEQPAISPYGHVMSYSSWSRCLTGTNICPLTKKPLKKRDLVILTWDNIDQYMENIANMN